MKKNTNCNGSHDNCPPQHACEKGKTKFVTSEVKKLDLDDLSVKTKHPVLDAKVVLADIDVEVDVEADVFLPKPAREIKSIRKNVSLKQCKAVPSSKDPHLVKLFITGILHKNIQFVEHCSGNVKDHSVDIHFTTIEKVWLDNPVRDPFGNKDITFSHKASVSEYRELADDGHGANRCVTGAETDEVFNEPIKCKLLATKIREIDLLKDFDHWGRFDKITEKMEIRLFIKLSQKQQVSYDPTPDKKPHHPHKD